MNEHFFLQIYHLDDRSISSVLDRGDEIGVETFLVKTQQNLRFSRHLLECTTWSGLVARPAGRYADAAAALAAAMTSSIGA